MAERRCCDHLPLTPMQTGSQGSWQNALLSAPRLFAQATQVGSSGGTVNLSDASAESVTLASSSNPLSAVSFNLTAAGTIGIGIFPNFFINAVNWSLGLTQNAKGMAALLR